MSREQVVSFVGWVVGVITALMFASLLANMMGHTAVRVVPSLVGFGGLTGVLAGIGGRSLTLKLYKGTRFERQLFAALGPGWRVEIRKGGSYVFAVKRLDTLHKLQVQYDRSSDIKAAQVTLRKYSWFEKRHTYVVEEELEPTCLPPDAQRAVDAIAGVLHQRAR